MSTHELDDARAANGMLRNALRNCQRERKEEKARAVELLEDLASRVAKCRTCEGTGSWPLDERACDRDACRDCGGVGELVEGWIDPHAVREALKTLKGDGP